MGIDHWVLQFLLRSYRDYGDFGETVQIGRQGLHIDQGGHGFANELFRRHDLDITYQEATRGGRYADEGLLQTFGATTVASADASAYEGATIVHDFNNPINPRYHQKYDTVLDGGTLQHIFNAPMALANEMNMTKIGGRILAILPANNWLGHGFYQFSPGMPYRVFTPENGFTVKAVFLSAMKDDHNLIEIGDLTRHGGGEICRTRTNTYLLYVAEKTAHVPVFRHWPQQGDYRTVWERHGDAPTSENVHLQPQSPPRRGLIHTIGEWLRLTG